MNYKQALALRDELLAEGQHTEVYADRCDKYCKAAGFMTVALKTERVWNERDGKMINKIVDEVHHINADRSGAITI